MALSPRPVFFNLLCATARLTLLDNTTALSSFYLYQHYTVIDIYQFITSILMSFSFTFAHPLVSGNVEEYHTLKSKNKLVYMLKFLMLFFPLTLTFACVCSLRHKIQLRKEKVFRKYKFKFRSIFLFIYQSTKLGLQLKNLFDMYQFNTAIQNVFSFTNVYF